MRTQLVKREDRWDLYDADGHKIASTLDGVSNKLSLRNCQAIERGYDLYELIDHITPKDKLTSNASERRNGYLKGFQKSLELMGDKKFSQDDVRKAFQLAIKDTDSKTIKSFENLADDIIQSLQQTEWDVEIEMENVMHDYNGNISLGAKFKLDADGCLILNN